MSQFKLNIVPLALALLLFSVLAIAEDNPRPGEGGGQGGPGSGNGTQSGPGNGSGGPGGSGTGQGGQGGQGPNNSTQGHQSNDNPGPCKPPRGDDPRPRLWGQQNDRNETEFDDRKSPRRISFLGKSANLRIYPNYADTSVWLQLRFSRLAELDAAGQPVRRHTVPSLAAADSAAFAIANTTLRGVNVSSVNVTLDPTTRPEFDARCLPPGDDAGGGGGGSRRALRADGAASVSVGLLFGMDDALVLPYGPENVTVPRNGLKWTIGYNNWPFCNTSNVLSVTLDLLLPANSTAQTVESSDSSGTQTLALSLGTAYNASLSFLRHALDSAAGSTRMPVTTSVNAVNGSRVTITMTLPNPAKYGVSSVWYDPTSTTTSTYLAADDPGNGYVAATSTSNSGNSPGGGGAKSARPGLVAAVMVALLVAVMAGL